MNTWGREPLARRGRPSAPPTVGARSPHRCFRGTPHVLRSSGAPDVLRHPQVTGDQGKSGGCDGENAGGRGWTAAGTRGGTARDTPPGVPHSLINPSSRRRRSHPCVSAGRGCAKICTGSSDLAIPSRCLNCRSAMSLGVICSRQLDGIQVCNQPPQELHSRFPGLRSRHAEAVDQPILDHIASGAALWEGYERQHPREKLLLDFTISAWPGLVGLHGTKHEVVPHHRARGSGRWSAPRNRCRPASGPRPLVHVGPVASERTGASDGNKRSGASPRGAGNHLLLCMLAKSVSRETSLA